MQNIQCVEGKIGLKYFFDPFMGVFNVTEHKYTYVYITAIKLSFLSQLFIFLNVNGMKK